MKYAGTLTIFLCIVWLFAPTIAAAQDPYHCDTLKVTCFEKSGIKVRYFNVPKSCLVGCTFCHAVAKQNWLEVEKQLKLEVKRLRGSSETFETLRTRLLTHRLVNFILPPAEPGRQKASMQIGFQVPYMTFAWNADFQLKKSRKTKPAYWKITRFESDSHIFSRLNTLAANFQQNLKADSVQLPPPLLPDQNYLAAWFGTRYLSATEKANLEALIKNQPKQAVATFIEKKDGIGLALMMAHQNLAVRYLALQGIKNIQDKTCLPYLLQLAGATIQPVETSPATEILYANFCEQLVSTIGILTNCNFNRCPFAHYPPQHYLRLGLPAWERRIEPNDTQAQGLGTYAIELSAD